MRPLVAHFINDGRAHTLDEAGQLYNYWLAENGLFVHARREGLDALVRAGGWLRVRGLKPLEPWVRVEGPTVPTIVTQAIVDLARGATRGGEAVESLFHLWWDGNVWQLHTPPQERSAGHVIVTETGEGSSYQRALIEVHSHHGMPAFWSEADNKDEQGFRLYGVLGHIFSEPVLRLRVGVYGYFWEIDPEIVFDLPYEMRRAA